MEFIDEHPNEFDVIITDAPDPVGGSFSSLAQLVPSSLLFFNRTCCVFIPERIFCTGEACS